MKIRPVESEFHADRRTDGRTDYEANSRFPNFVSASKYEWRYNSTSPMSSWLTRGQSHFPTYIGRNTHIFHNRPKGLLLRCLIRMPIEISNILADRFLGFPRCLSSDTTLLHAPFLYSPVQFSAVKYVTNTNKNNEMRSSTP